MTHSDSEIEFITKKILEENGIYSYITKDDEPLNCDSLTFMSIVVGIENELHIVVDDSLLTEYPRTYNEYVEFIKNAVNMYENRDENEDEDEDEDED